MKRALLIFNPQATSVSAPVRDVIAHALSSELKVELAETKRRHHATHLASGAAHEGYDVVISLAGDGTLNEIINGLIGTETPVIPLPGGGTNVFARAVGLPRDPIEATATILGRLESGAQPRRINVGRVNGRAFCCNVGIGFDAAIVKAVERRFRLKRQVGDAFFVYQGLRLFFFAYPRRERPLHLDVGTEHIGPLHQIVVCNSNPYTYLGDRPFQLCPMASLERGLDLTGLASFRTMSVLRVIARAFGSGGHAKMRSVHTAHDLDAFTVTSDRPLLYQVDGDLAGEGTRFDFENLPRALAILA
jgi:diacylglycerol kinase family enzyme